MPEPGRLGRPGARQRPDRAVEPPLYPDNPVLVRIWRGAAVESQHRGAFGVVDDQGQVLEGAGDLFRPVFVRSSIKSLQALPLLESGAAEAFGVDDAELALALSSHNAQALHVEGVAAWLERLGLAADDLQCGAQVPGDPATRTALREAGEAPTTLHNNCSGKHTGFLTLALKLGQDPAEYLARDGAVQRRIFEAVQEMTDAGAADFGFEETDGCNAPTFRMPLRALGNAFARLAGNAGGDGYRLASTRRAACERMLDAVAAHPAHIAGDHKRLCTDLVRVTRGRLFPKIGAEAVYAIAERGRGRAFVCKVDDGGLRGLHALVIGQLERHGFLDAGEAARLERWREPILRNWAGTEVGRTEVCE